MTDLNQEHKGTGDNVGRDKNVTINESRELFKDNTQFVDNIPNFTKNESIDLDGFATLEFMQGSGSYVTLILDPVHQYNLTRYLLYLKYKDILSHFDLDILT